MGWKVAVYTNPQSIKVRYRGVHVTALPCAASQISDLKKKKTEFRIISKNIFLNIFFT
jgi:hypothetical protein